MDCRPQCGACCIAPSIHSPIPGMPDGKPAGTPCIQLDQDYRCKLFGSPDRPDFCGGLQPHEEMCGNPQQTRTYAIQWLNALELATRPDVSP